MENPGIWNLGDYSLTTAVTGEVITENSDGDACIDDLEGMLAANVQIKFAYGSGGTSLKVYIQTTLDQGATWIDVACAAFLVASATKVINLSGLTPKTTAATPSDGSMTDDTALDGVLGDRWRAKITSTGTYAGSTTLSVRMMAR
ncbi:hypothetical protein [Mesorhizobium sp. KR9-304]|uniref:hypothetical protein n=1 Tax=Mesorhizobium sp. KR9-304 TaxID=3156614 RepID=UPI0032B611F2